MTCSAASRAIRLGLSALALGVGVEGRLHAQASNDTGRGAEAKPRRQLPPGWESLRKPAGRWLGQDGHDAVGPSPAPGGSDVQDIHILLGGLPAGRAVASGVIKGLGGSEWVINGPPQGSWKAELVREPGATVADLYLEPSQVETGRPFFVELKFDDDRKVEFTVSGGKADPNLRMPHAALKAHWLGQDRHDRVGPGPAVGPDGIQDARIALANLSPKVEVTSVKIEAKGGGAWQSGVNPDGLGNAELVRRANDPSRADLFFAPERDVAGTELTLLVSYANGKTDRTRLDAGRCNPTLAMPKGPAPSVRPLRLTATWKGQDRARGEVSIALEGLPRDKRFVGAILSDQAGGCWTHRAGEPTGPDRLAFRRANDLTKAELAFAPIRDESGAGMTLRLVDQDGTSWVARFRGGPCDVSLRSAPLGTREAVAKPGDDLQSFVDRSDRITLRTGEYRLARPLVLAHPVRLEGSPGAVLRFSQKAGDTPWSAALKIHCGNTHLEGFAIRFDSSIRWAAHTSYGPAVIGTTDNHDPGTNDDPKFNLTLKRLDLQAPPPSGSWEEAPHLFRLASASSGRIEGNTLKGGSSELFRGPWQVLDNDHRGTLPNTYAYSVFSAHRTHDVVVRGNRVRALGPSGKMWRFLVMTESGSSDLVADNVVSGVGPRDDDTIPSANAPEIILTEAYRIHFEGEPEAISADGQVVTIPPPQGDPAATGDVVAVLAGPHAGQWRRIAQALSPSSYLLDEPLPSGALPGAIAIVTGFVGEIFLGNTVDARGSAVAVDLFLAGNHFGTRVIGNHMLGAGGFRIVACPSEQPVHWGWSHAPVFGAVIEGNSLEDTAVAGAVAVEHGPAIKSTRGRVYLTAQLANNVVKWSGATLSQPAGAGKPKAPTGIVIGETGSLDMGELRLTADGNRVEGSAGARGQSALTIRSGTLNGRATAEGAGARSLR
jgi:hypothetical protein